MPERVEVHQRDDGKYDWRKLSVNENIVSTSGGQGYSRLIDAIKMAKQENPGVPVFEVYVDEKTAE